MLEKVKLSTLLAFGSGVILVLLASVGIFTLVQMRSLSDINQQLYEHPFTVSNTVLRVDGNIVRIHRAMKDVALATDEQSLMEASAKVDKLEQKVLADFQIIEERFLGNPQMHQRAKKLFLAWKPIRDEVISLMRAGQTRQASDITKGKGARHVDKILMAMGDLSDFAQNKALEYERFTAQTEKNTFYIVLSMIAFALLLGIVLTFVIVRTVVHVVELRQAANRLNFFETTVAQMTDPVYWVSPEGGLLYANQAACDCLGYSREELLEKRVWDVDPSSSPEAWTRRWRDIEESKDLHLTVQHRRKNGDLIPVDVRIHRVIFQGEAYISAFAHDITTEKMAEETRKRLESQLQHAQRMEVVGTMAGGIAHDFNNILGGIIGYSELCLLETEEGAVKPNNLQQIIKAAMRARDLVMQILTYSRKVEPQRSLLNPEEVIEKAVALAERTIPKMVSLDLNLARDLYKVTGDAAQLEQVILNLVSNATDAMPDGGTLHIETRNIILDADYATNHIGAYPGHFVLITVTDTGHGMDQETLQHIFDPFFTTKDVGKGTGLGLSSVFGIIKSHGGNINCYSELGSGTTFKIYLPAHNVDEVPAESHETDLSAYSGKEHILLVDDDESLRVTGTRFLSMYGYQVITAESGEQALEVFESGAGLIDLVIMDLGMPGMGGKKAIEKLKARHPKAKVLIASGYAANGLIKEALDAGGDGFIPKPFLQADMLQKVREVLDRPENAEG